MALVYERAGNGPIRQAELLKSVSEFQVVANPDGDPAEVFTRRIEHPLVIVLSQDCDLEQDFDFRFPAAEDPPSHSDIEVHPRTLSHIILCDVFEEGELKQRVPESFGSRDYKRIDQNQNERYHRFDGAGVAGTAEEIEPLFLDFKRHFSIPCSSAYEQLDSGPMGRTARLPAYYLHDLNHRFYSYLARVAIP